MHAPIKKQRACSWTNHLLRKAIKKGVNWLSIWINRPSITSPFPAELHGAHGCSCCRLSALSCSDCISDPRRLTSKFRCYLFLKRRSEMGEKEQKFVRGNWRIQRKYLQNLTWRCCCCWWLMPGRIVYPEGNWWKRIKGAGEAACRAVASGDFVWGVFGLSLSGIRARSGRLIHSNHEKKQP